jgi:hypothetical protein
MADRKIIACGLLGLGLIVASAAPALAREDPRRGAWAGMGLQTTAAGQAKSWTMEVSFGEVVRVNYPSLGCSGAWAREGGRYREKISKGDCISGGLVTLHEQDGKLFATWTVRGEKPDIAAAAVLFPAPPIG